MGALEAVGTDAITLRSEATDFTPNGNRRHRPIDISNGHSRGSRGHTRGDFDRPGWRPAAFANTGEPLIAFGGR